MLDLSANRRALDRFSPVRPRFRSHSKFRPLGTSFSVIAATARIQEIIDGVYEKYKDIDEGTVATYIPELAKANPDDFGICLATVDGQVFTVGDWQKEFTIQSMCKPFAFQMALEKHGREATLKRVGVEPSGDAFNSIELHPKTTLPYNPMINAGAIAISSLIKQTPVEDGIQAFMKKMEQAAGRKLRLDHAVLASETATGHRNRAIAYFMLNFDIIDEEVHQALHQYFAQCSLLVNCHDLAIMSATLANIGTNPLTKERVFDFQFIKYVLTVMFTCGLYDYAGGWAYEVGVPAKSGDGGGILAVVNRQLGIGVYSPKLDAQGNSVRGILACKEIASIWDCTRSSSPTWGRALCSGCCEDSRERRGPARKQCGLEFRGECLAVAIGKVRADAARLGENNPDFFGAVSEVQLHFQIKLRRGVRFRRDLDCESGSAFEVTVGISSIDLRAANEAGVRFQKRFTWQLEPCCDVDFTKPLLAYIGPERVIEIVPDERSAHCCRRSDDVLALNQLVVHVVVFVSLELLECQTILSGHGHMITRSHCRQSVRRKFWVNCSIASTALQRRVSLVDLSSQISRRFPERHRVQVPVHSSLGRASSQTGQR